MVVREPAELVEYNTHRKLFHQRLTSALLEILANKPSQ